MLGQNLKANVDIDEIDNHTTVLMPLGVELF